MSRRPPADENAYTGDTLPLAAPKTAGPPAARRGTAPARRTPMSLRRIVARVGVGLLALFLLACAGLLVVQQQVAQEVALRDVRSSRPIARPLVAPMNILLAGVDSRAGHPEEGVRSDTMLMLHLDPLGGWANLLAIPRDSLVAIPGNGNDKINTAFSYGHDQAEAIYGPRTSPEAGGAALAATTVEQFLGLRSLGTHIDYMATVDFDGFAKMIDALGGIDVDVPRTIVDDEYPTPDFGTMRIEIPAGHQHFDGARALQYVRTRHADSDFGRGQRQQQVIASMVTSLRDRSLPFKAIAAYRLMRAAGAAIHTTLPVGRPDALLLGALMLRLNPGEIGNYRIAPDNVTLVAEQGSNLVWDQAGVQKLAREALARPGEAQEQAIVQVRNGAGVSGLALSVTGYLSDNGFTTGEPETGEAAVRSAIWDFTGKPRTRAHLQKTLGGMRVETHPSGDAPPGVDLLVVLGDDYTRFIPKQ